MSERVRVGRPGGRPGRWPSTEEEGPAAWAAAVFDAAARTHEAARGGDPAIGRAIGDLHANAGNEAIARLFAGSLGTGHRTGRAHAHAAHAGLTGRAAVQREVDDQPRPEAQVPSAEGSDASALGTGAPAHGPSWTHVGPPSNATYDVSGSLRDVATTIAARTEAGSVKATPTSDTDTWTPDGGTETIIAARVTVDQVVELPAWTDKDKATKNQQAEWDRFHAAITTHEAGHVSTDRASFAAAHAAMVGQSPGDGDTKLDAVTEKAKTDNETYDTTTKHGLTQGTGINPNIDEVTKVP